MNNGFEDYPCGLIEFLKYLANQLIQRTSFISSRLI